MPSRPASAMLGGDALGAGHADVGHAVGAEHDDVDAAGTVRRPGLLVAQRQAVGQVGAAARVEVVDRGQHALVLGDRGRRRAAARPGRRTPTTETVSSGRSDPASSARESFTRPMRLPSPMLPERSTTRVRLTDGRSSAATSRAVTATRTSWRAVGLGPDARLGADGEVGLGRRRVAVREGVDPLLRAHRLRRRAGALGDVRLRDPVRAVVDVEGERRQRVARGVDVAADALVDEGVVPRRSAGRLGGSA